MLRDCTRFSHDDEEAVCSPEAKRPCDVLFGTSSPAHDTLVTFPAFLAETRTRRSRFSDRALRVDVAVPAAIAKEPASPGRLRRVRFLVYCRITSIIFGSFSHRNVTQ